MTSSAELSEALNSMYLWYQNAKVCYAHLADVQSEGELVKSRWFTRGLDPSGVDRSTRSNISQ
ncbi:hypothetical protein BDV59DRAFT_174479 [Aspergillus ambiguus]|uniref:uncharacterized protein n=1 Tax=Aspergillus ambiguus TaxID=176160 RepID=UPI003CCD0E7E